MTLRKLVIQVIFVAILLPAAAAAETKLKAPETKVPPTYFGLHIHYSSDRDWPSVKFGSWRLTGDHVVWYDLEPQKGQWNFKELDKDVALAEKNHVQLMLTFAFTPTWASARPQEIRALKDHPGYTAEPKDINDWREYVRTVGTRYKGRIQAYELWNEPNGQDFYSGTVDELVRLAKEGYTILHEVDPKATVISPSPSGSGLPFLDKYLAAGGGQYADVIGFHFYVTPEAPEAMVGMAEKIKQTMAKYGVSRKPLWCTETGYFNQSQYRKVEPLGTNFPVLTNDQFAAYVARAYILVWASGVERLYWYGWDDGSMGIADGEGIANSGTARKLAADAYDRVADWLLGATMTSCSSDSTDTWICDIEREGMYGGHIVWNTRGDRTFAIPKAWNVRWQVNIYGPSRNVEGAKETQIGAKPILLQNKAVRE